MIQAATRRAVQHPLAPKTLEESGLTLDLVVQLVLKTLYFSGELTGIELAKRLAMNFSVIEPATELLVSQHHTEIISGLMLGRESYRYRITDAGRSRAALFLENNHYVGFAPVPLEQYRRYMIEYQKLAPQSVLPDRIRKAFSHLVISDEILDKLGPAVNSGHSLFLYGPPGNGKTVIGQALAKLLTGEIAVPHALEIEGSIVRIFDPVNHETLPIEEAEPGLDTGTRYDRRWIRCRRPIVMVGGELTLESLDLTYSANVGFYRAPVQAIANGGLLLVDDFGRQHCSPRDLLNRWIVPLGSGVDYLTLQSGLKFELPFMVLVVFATNLKPAELVDEAFLRRIQYKIFAESPRLNDFAQIFENCCRERSLAFDRSLVERMLRDYYRPRKIELRACQPRDLIDQALSMAEYLGQPRRLTYELLEAACASYFVDDTEAPPVYA